MTYEPPSLTTSGENMNLRLFVQADVVAHPSEAIFVIVQVAGAELPIAVLASMPEMR